MTVYLLEEFGVDKNTGNPIKVLKIGKTKRNFWERYKEYCTHVAYVKFLNKLGNVKSDTEKRLHILFNSLRYWGFDDKKQKWIQKEEFFYYSEDIINIFNLIKKSSPERRETILTNSEFLVNVCFKLFNLDKIDDSNVMKTYIEFNLVNLRKSIQDCLNLNLSWFKKMKDFYKKVNVIVHGG